MRLVRCWPTVRLALLVRRALLAVAVGLVAACHEALDAPVAPGAAAPDAADTLFTAVAVGAVHTCALTRGGRAFCWGLNNLGELGTDAVDNGPDAPEVPCRTSPTTCSIRPVAVTGGHRFVQLAVVRTATCGLEAGGRVLCWGGSALPTARNVTPVAVPGAPALRTLAASSQLTDRLCGLDADARAWCWVPGLAATAPTSDSAQARVLGGTVGSALRFRDVGDACGTTSAGAFYCWNHATVDTTVFDPGGVVNPRCPLGSDRNTGPVFGPCTTEALRLNAPSTMTLRTAGSLRSCGLDAAGGAVCWGAMLTALLGSAATSTDPYASGLRPAPVSLPAPVVSLFGSDAWLCGRTADGAVYCRGGLPSLDLSGNGVPATSASASPREPVLVAGGMRFATVDAGTTRMCGVDLAGVLYCWGSDGDGALGSGATARDPCYPLGFFGNAFNVYECAMRPQRIASITGR